MIPETGATRPIVPPPPPPPPEERPAPAGGPRAGSAPSAGAQDGVTPPGPDAQSWRHEGDGAGGVDAPDSGMFTAPTHGPSPEQRAQVDAAAAEFERSVREDPPLAATRKLNEKLEGLSPELRGAFLEKTGGSVEQLTEKVTQLDKGETAQAVKDLARGTELAGPLHADKLTRPMARAIADGKLEQKGDDANAGVGGLLKGANTHHSEREFIDGVKDLGDGPGAQLFKDSLTGSLTAEGKASSGERADRANGFAGAVVSGNSDQVLDDGVWTGLRNVAKDVGAKIGEAAQRVDQAKERFLDGALDKTLNLSDSIDQLDKPGESLKIGANGQVSAKVHGELEGEMELTRTEDGYTLKASGTALAGVGAAKNKVAVGGSGAVEFKFDTKEEAKEATQALLKGNLASPHEMDTLYKNISAVEVGATGGAGFDALYGLSEKQGGGAEGKAKLNVGGRVEFENGKPVALVGVAELKGEAAGEISNLIQKYGAEGIPEDKAQEIKQRLGFDPRSLGDLQGRGVVEGSIRVEVRTPITGVPDGNPLEQAQAIARDPGSVKLGTPTGSVTIKGSAELNNKGVEFEEKIANLSTDQVGTFLERAVKGDIRGAVAGAGGTVEASYSEYKDDSQGWADHTVDLAVAQVGGKNYVRNIEEKHVLADDVPSADGKRLVDRPEERPVVLRA
jgi:hypothetical protein